MSEQEDFREKSSLTVNKKRDPDGNAFSFSKIVGGCLSMDSSTSSTRMEKQSHGCM